MAREEDEIEQQVPGEPPAPEPKPPESIRINVSDDADDEDDGPEQKPGEKPSRRGGYKALKESNRELSERLTRAELALAEQRGRQSVPAPVVVRESAGERPDPVKSALENIETQKEAALQALRAATDPASAAKYQKQWYALDEQRADIIAERAANRARRQQPAEDTDQRIGQATLEASFPRLFNGQGSTAFKLEAQAEASRIEEGGRGVSSGRSALSVAQEAAQIVYARHGLGGQKKPAATDTDRARHTSTGTKPSGGGKDMWTPSRQQKVNALAYTEHRKGLTDEQRYRAWYNEVGKPGGLV